jgi:SAM-dependent methyltransferase
MWTAPRSGRRLGAGAAPDNDCVSMSATFLHGHDSAVTLRCPICPSELTFEAAQWYCSGPQRHVFPDLAWVPILLNPARSVFRAEDFRTGARTTFKDPAAWALRLGRLLPSPSRDVSAERCRRRLAQLLAQRPVEHRRVLVIGCGDGSVGYGVLADVEGALWLETDVSLAGRAAIVCDASDLPFHDGRFDLVVCIAVLEHVLEPQRCVEEMHRVLAEDGIIYATTPFMQQVHMGEYDFTRFTRSGHRWLFRNFDETDSGVATGPASVVVWSVEYFLMSWTASVAARRVAKGLTRLLLGWMTLLDPLLARRDGAYDAGGGFYFIGRRAAGPTVSGRDMIAYYRGADALK